MHIRFPFPPQQLLKAGTGVIIPFGVTKVDSAIGVTGKGHVWNGFQQQAERSAFSLMATSACLRSVISTIEPIAW
jgi:hypothetical protein